jgi:hypothetical protein
MSDHKYTRLETALILAEAGITVFPADPITKRPYKAARFSGGARWGATRDRRQIISDFNRWPNAALCMPTGRDNGVWVVEADTMEGHGVDGIGNFQKVIDANSPLPETRMVRSPSGSIHRWFKNPDRLLIQNSESKIAQGVDVLGEGGMVLIPPSVKPGVGEYVWLNYLKNADASQWLLDLVAKKDSSKRNHDLDDTTINIDKVIAALDAATNVNLCEDQWYRIMAAAWRGSNGDDAAYRAFVRWSARSTKRNHDIKRTQARWDAFADKPPHDIGVGTLYRHADETAPGWRERLLEESLASLKEEYDAAMAAYVKGGSHA